MTDVTNPIPYLCLLNTDVQSFLRYFHQSVDLRCRFSNYIGPTRIRNAAFQIDTHIDFYQITVFQRLFTRESMTNFIIYTDTSRIFIPFKANLRSNSAMTLDIVSDKYLNIPTCDSWFYKITQIFMYIC